MPRNLIELRHLRCFMGIARERTITRAAEALHISQPALSRTLQELEEELGQPLINRRKPLTLTPKGELLLKRTTDLLDFFEHMCTEVSAAEEELDGTITIAAGESPAVDFLATCFFKLQQRHPKISFSIVSGNEDTVTDALSSGMCDFGVFIGSPKSLEYERLHLPHFDTWGIIVPASHPLAAKSAVTAEDFAGLNLILSNQAWRNNEFTGWLGRMRDKVQVTGSYNLPYNGYVFAKNHGCPMLALEDLVQINEGDNMRFIPLTPRLRVDTTLVWQSAVYSSPLSQAFLNMVKDNLPRQELSDNLPAE